MKLGKGVGKFIVKAAKEAGEEAAEQGVKQIIKQSPKHVKKMAHMAVDEAGNVTKKAIKTISENKEAWGKAKETIKDTTKKMWENKKNTWNEDFKRIQEMYNNKEFDLDEAREYIKGFYYKDLSPEKEEELVKTLESNRKKFNKQKNKQSRRQQNANSGHQQTGQIDMEDFKTANEMEVDTNNNFNADDFDTGNQGSGGTLDFDTDDEAFSFIEEEDFKYRRTKGQIDRVQNKNTGEVHRVIRDDNGKVIALENGDQQTVGKNKLNKFEAKDKELRGQYVDSLEDADWDKAYKDAGEYGFRNQEAVLHDRKVQNAKKIKELDKEIEATHNYKDKATKKKRKELEEKKAKLQSKEAGFEYREEMAKRKAGFEADMSAAEEKFKKSVEGLNPDDAAYKEAEALFNSEKEILKEQFDNAQDLLKDRTQGKVAAIQDPSGAMGKVMKGLGAAFTVKSAVDKYKESRAEGRSVVSSAVRAGASAAAADMLGPWGSMALGLMQAAPGAVIGATNFVASEYRRMNSAANFTPLGGTSFQDSQQLATMRQSGMELAKMSQYNLEQTLMGAEAKHLHR